MGILSEKCCWVCAQGGILHTVDVVGIGSAVVMVHYALCVVIGEVRSRLYERLGNVLSETRPGKVS